MRKNVNQSAPLFVLGTVTRFVLLLVVLMAFGNAAMAYTIVFRDGHKIETPSLFALTTSTLTYEAAPGINRTVQLILIDVTATERANNETSGSFFKHAERSALTTPPLAAVRHAQRTLTNEDLESIKQRRIESEQTYEKRRIELGLPSVEETRRRQAQEEEATLELARRRAKEEANQESYWRGRAASLRNEIVSVDGEINYVSARLGRPIHQGPFISPGFVTGAFPATGQRIQPGAGRMGTMGPSSAGSPRLTNTGAVALGPTRPVNGGFGSIGSRRGFGLVFPVVPYGYNDTSYDLTLKLNDLWQRRSGLDALWRELEYEARMANVPQVWLRP